MRQHRHASHRSLRRPERPARRVGSTVHHRLWGGAFGSASIMIATVLLTSCGGGVQPSPPPVGAPLPTPNPLSVTPHPDATTSASAVVPPTGGNVSLTAPDGSTYQLVLPDGALLSAETITLTALSGVDGLPTSGGFVAGVTIDPDGLYLLKPATLTVTPSSTVPSGELAIGFGYHGSGTEFHLVPMDAVAGAMVFSLVHFSGYGVGAGTQTDVETQQHDHPPTSPQDWADQSLAGHPNQETVSDVLYNEGLAILGRALAAGQMLPLIDEAAMLYSSWAPTAMADARAAALVPQVEAALVTDVNTAVSIDYGRCVGAKDLKAGLDMVRLAVWAQRTLPLYFPPGQFIQQINSCLTFQLKVDSTLGTDSSMTVQLTGQIPIDNVGGTLPPSLTGNAVLHHGTMTLDPGPGCTGSITSAYEDVATVPNLDLVYDFMEPDSQASQLPDIVWSMVTVTFNPGMPEETVAVDCPDNGGPVTSTSPVWAGLWATQHATDVDVNRGGFDLRGWEASNQTGVLALRHYVGVPGDPVTEDSTFTLLFTPAP